MMRNHKLPALLLAVTMIFALLAGCAGTQAPAQGGEDGTPSAAAGETGAQGAAGEAEPAPANQGGVPQPEGYPSRTISWIVAADAGAAIDLPTRVLLDNLDLGTSVMIENISGASNATGTLEAKVRDGDGYTILTTNSSGMVSQPILLDTGYTPDDFRHIALLEPLTPHAVVVSADSAIDSAEDWVAYVQSGEGFFYATPNAGSASHLATITALDELGSTTGTFVPQNGSAEVLAAVQNGSIDFGVLGVSDSIIPQAAAGNIKIIVLLDDTVCEMVPDLPLISDFGVTGCDCFHGFKYVAVHKDTPDEIVEWLKQEITAALQSDAYAAYIEQQGLVSPTILTEEEMTAVVYRTYETYARLLDELGMAA